MSAWPRGDKIEHYEEFLLVHHSQGTLDEITNWIDRNLIECSSNVEPNLFNFIQAVRRVLRVFIREENLEAVEALWQAVARREFRSNDGASPVATSVFRTYVCHIMTQIILETGWQHTRRAAEFRKLLRTCLRHAIRQHHYVQDTGWMSLLRRQCLRALDAVGRSESERKLPRNFEAQETAALQHAARPEHTSGPARRCSRESQEETPEPITYCQRHSQQLILLALGHADRSSSDASPAREQDNSGPESPTPPQPGEVIVIDSSPESLDAREQDNRSSGLQVPGRADEVIVIDSSSESRDHELRDISQAREQGNRSSGLQVPGRADEVIVIDSSSESRDHELRDIGRAREQDDGSSGLRMPNQPMIANESSSESVYPESSYSSQAGEPAVRTPESSVPDPASQMAAIDSSSESGDCFMPLDPEPRDIDQVGELVNRNPDPSMLDCASRMSVRNSPSGSSESIMAGLIRVAGLPHVPGSSFSRAPENK